MSSIRPDLKFSDDRDQASFYKKYLRLPGKNARTLRVVDKGDYYILLDEDAELVADLIYKTQSVLKTVTVENRQIQYVTLSQAVFANLLKLVVVDSGYKLEIYGKYWDNMKLASPGNLGEIEEFMDSSEVSYVSIIAALKLVNSSSDGKKVCLSFYDPNSKYIGLAEFNDTDLYSNLESVLIQLGIKECLIPAKSSSTVDPDLDKVKQLIDRCDIVISEHRASEFTDKNIEQDLIRLTGNELVLSTNELSSLDVALGCSNALISYLSLLSDDSNSSALTIGRYNLEQFMKLDYAAVKALNLFPPPSINKSLNKNSSLFGLLNNCKTVGGTKLLSQWLKQPLVDVKEIRKRHMLVGHLVEDMNLRTDLQKSFLNDVPDVSRLVKKLTANNKSSRLDDVIRLYQLCVKLPDLLEFLQSSIDGIMEDTEESAEVKELIMSWWIEPITEYSTKLIKFQEMIETTIDIASLEEATSAQSTSSMISINPEFDENLLRINDKIKKIKQGIKDIHSDTADDLNMDIDKKLKLEDHHVHGWCFRLTRNDSSCLRGNKKYRELSTVKAGVYFTTSELSQLSTQIKNLQEDYQRAQNDVVKEIISIASTYSPVFIKLAIEISKLDVLVSFAHTSAFAPTQYIRPSKMHSLNSPERNLELVDARHPCLEQQDGLIFISNDISFKKGTTEFIIITGPNMGGKSTYIRTAGVIALMNQIGCFIPCNEGSEICIFDSILARVGASDSQLKGVSTFMSEMLEMSSILQSATENSLIIVDELGRGTSTYDGFGLAWSISEFISKKLHAFTMFATHFHELTAMADQVDTVKNLHVVAHVEDVIQDAEQQKVGTDSSVTLLYKVEPGISDQSFGVHVAEVVKFPQKIIAMAKRKANELDDHSHGISKRGKFTDEEVLKGNSLFEKILKTWKAKVDQMGDVKDLDSDTVTDVLIGLVKGDDAPFKSEFESDKVVQEMLCL
ncbi:hypothetical protein CANARDRAFT_27910 [[Candida] arabinofermentans NRRL YB-2248]|uniref:DNA mismatch repair proteins mutS family domain-containing protein n=1 Tax=[Candida] arabinofermentans NRRL YB-2248 TaxID=983967 RepID=A0A1E4T255_9ASCO|nr:hypothetical protein CANARDRAFT_27910 [[Candida] arabinofermentans NRRL YB-2248]